VKNLVPGVINVSAPLVNQGALFKYFNAAVAGKGLNNYSDICPGYTSPTDPNPPPNGSFQDTYNCNTQRGIEQVSSAYISGNFMLGGVQIIPGLRFEHTDIHNDFYVLENNSVGHFASDSTKYDKLLPSIAANYRPNALTVYRAAIWTSYVKPSMFQLGGGEQISFSPDSSSPTGETENITKSNPNLKPIDAINYDASGEWRNTFGGYAVVAVFYKSLNHFTYSQVDSYTNQTSGGSEFVTVSTPENGGSGRVYGLELTGRQKFTGMPAPFNGFGLASNLTLERSAVHTEEAGLDPTERLQDQPNTTANAQLFYEKGPISAQLSYRYTGSYVAGYSVLGDGGPASSQLDAWVQDSTRLDLHVAYRLPSGLSLEASASNLLDAPSAYETIGKNTNIIPDIVNSGRTFDFVARYSF
jgi:TonB-dependent receptor